MQEGLSRFFALERAAIVREQDASEDKKDALEPTQQIFSMLF